MPGLSVRLTGCRPSIVERVGGLVARLARAQVEQQLELDEVAAADDAGGALDEALRAAGLDLAVLRRCRRLGDQRLEPLLDRVVERRRRAARRRSGSTPGSRRARRSSRPAWPRLELLRRVADAEPQVDVLAELDGVDHAAPADRLDVPATPVAVVTSVSKMKPGLRRCRGSSRRRRAPRRRSRAATAGSRVYGRRAPRTARRGSRPRAHTRGRRRGRRAGTSRWRARPRRAARAMQRVDGVRDHRALRPPSPRTSCSGRPIWLGSLLAAPTSSTPSPALDQQPRHLAADRPEPADRNACHVLSLSIRPCRAAAAWIRSVVGTTSSSRR